MHAYIPSQTAVFVAFLRALADLGFTHVPGFRDPFAHRFLPRAWSSLLRGSARWLGRLQPAVRERVVDQLDVVARRVRAIDRELAAAIGAGCTQVVILGAGLDTRAYRLPHVSVTSVYEVDRHATQDFKRRKAAGIPVLARNLHYVTFDFESEALSPSLGAAGHRADLPTAWVWEGGAMYLTDGALRAALATMVELSADGSVFIVHYHEPEARARDAWKPGFARWVFEPQIGLRSRSEMIAELENTGLRVVHDSQVDQHQPVARLLVADKPESS